MSLSADHGGDMQKIFLCYFGILGLACLCILYGSLIGIVVGTNVGLQDSIETDLNKQVKAQAYSTLNEAGDYLTRVLNSYDQSVSNMTSDSMTNLMRPDYVSPNNLNPTLYWDMEGGVSGLKPTVTYDNPRFKDQPISTGASAGYVMDTYSPSNTLVPTLMTNKINWYDCNSNDCINMREQLGASATLDPLLIHTWNTNLEIVQMFLGFNTVPPSLRRYPGRPAHYPPNPDRSATNTPITPVYNPTLRGWYTSAVTARPATIFTAPYPDFHKLGWMITGAKALYKYERPMPTQLSSTTPIGVFGIDILITDISNVLNKIKFLDTGKLTLFSGSNGQVVTDIEWDSSIKDSIYETRDPNNQGFFYTDLKSPVVTTSTWNKIRSTPAGQQKEILIMDPDDDDIVKELIFVSHLKDYDEQYYLVVFVDQIEIIKPVQPAIDEMVDANKVTTGVLMGTLVGSMIFLMLLMLFIIQSIVAVFNDMQTNVEHLLRNVGTGKGLADGMVEIHDDASNELTALQENMNTMVHDLQKAREGNYAVTNASTHAAGHNQGKNQLNSLWNIVPMASAIDASAPPIANEFVQPDEPAPPPAYESSRM